MPLTMTGSKFPELFCAKEKNENDIVHAKAISLLKEIDFMMIELKRHPYRLPRQCLGITTTRTRVVNLLAGIRAYEINRIRLPRCLFKASSGYCEHGETG